MKNNSCRYIINASGKGGETYMTHCQDKHELNQWIAERKDKLLMDEIKITDKKKNPFFKWFSFLK